MCPPIKFANDTILIGLVNRDDENAYFGQPDSFVESCDKKYLELNVSKAKVMITNFHKNTVVPSPVLTEGANVERF